MNHSSIDHGVEWDRFVILGGERIPLRTPTQVASEINPVDDRGGLIRVPGKIARWVWRFIFGDNVGEKNRRELSMTVDPQFRHLILSADTGWLSEFFAAWTGYQRAWYSAIAMSAQMSVLRNAVESDITSRAGELQSNRTPSAPRGMTRLVRGAGIPHDLAKIASFDTDRGAKTA